MSLSLLGGEGKEAVVLQNWGDIRNGNALSALLY